ncbi:UbiH/UbiF family hydroxylase [Bosea sp. 117]|uniref:UbiH/UbiF family hydroxylase n=1 Tax=Bosea sp. 117 TaxID=1125973 RepID=UPI0020BDF496|nr:UbiH/UbiF family hydroxylase [Bosea sp. 117]
MSDMPSETRSSPQGEAIVVGGGAAGLITALALAAAGAQVHLLAPARRPDPRATALMDGSVKALEALGLWAELRPNASPLRVMRLVDDTRRLLRAPEVSFHAREMEIEAFAWNVENEALNDVLERAVATRPAIARVEGELAGLRRQAGQSVVTLGDGRTLSAALVAAADGRESAVRRLLGIAAPTRPYPQVAVTATLEHERAHEDISTEFHTETGPCVLVPLPGRRCSIVCVTSPAEAETLMALDDEGFGLAIETRTHSLLGRMRLVSPRGSFPLAARTAEHFSAERTVLVGEAAHVIPPIGAQGLNLGIRDAATLAELVADALRAGADIGSDAVTQAYERRRRADVASRTFAVDLANRSLLSELMPVHGMRGFALWLMGRVPALRHAMMREGIGPSRDVPRLVAGKPL